MPKIIRDYVDFPKSTGVKFQSFTVSLTATFDTKKEAENFAKDLEEFNESLKMKYG